MTYSFQAKVSYIEEARAREHVGGVGQEAQFVSNLVGWRVGLVIDRSFVAIIFPANDKPDLASGDTVKITMEKVSESKPSA